MHSLFLDDRFMRRRTITCGTNSSVSTKADFDITLEDVMTSFPWMEIEHNKKDIAIHLDTYVLETLGRVQDGCVEVPQIQEGTYAAGGDAGAGGLPRDS